MTVLTRRAQEIFAPTTAAGKPRGPVITHVRAWGTEIERGIATEGSWTPALTFETAGDQSIAYTTQTGVYLRIGRLYLLQFIVNTSTFTHTTASGRLLITGMPVVGGAHELRALLADYRGITKANYSKFSVGAPEGESYLILHGAGSGQTLDESITTADLPTGGTVTFRGTAQVMVDHS